MVKNQLPKKWFMAHLDQVVKSVGHIGGDGEGDGGEQGGGQAAAAAENWPAAPIFAIAKRRGQRLSRPSEKLLENVTPVVEVKSRRVGGSTYQVPVEIRETRRVALAMRWLVEFASQRSQKGMMMRLAQEILDAIGGRGGAVKKRDDVHRMAKANQAFAHYRW